jgi:hypothetical protein
MVGGHEFYPIEVSSAVFARKPEIEFKHLVTSFLIVRDSPEIPAEVQFSLNGSKIDGTLTWEDEFLEVENAEVSKIWFKASVPGIKLRVYAAA